MSQLSLRKRRPWLPRPIDHTVMITRSPLLLFQPPPPPGTIPFVKSRACLTPKMSQHKHNYQHHHHLHQQHHNHQNQQQHWEHQEQYQSTLPVGLIARLSALPPPPLNQQEHGQEHLTRIILTETEGSAVPPRLALPGRPQFWPRCLISYQGLRLEERRPSLFHLTGQPSANFLSIPTSRYELLATMTTDGERAMFSSHRGKAPLRPHPLGGSRPEGPRQNHTAACSVSWGSSGH